MYTCQVLTDRTQCYDFVKCKTLFGALLIKPPPHTTWWGWDLCLGSNHYMLSMRHTVNERPEYMIWKSFNNTSLSTSQIIMTTSDIPYDIPLKFIFVWTVAFMSDLFAAKWTGWRFRVPWFDAPKVKDV